MAMTLYATNVYSNDGNKLLWSVSTERSITIYVDENGFSTDTNNDQLRASYGYGGSREFIGISTSPNTSTPTYGIGSSFTTAQSTLNLYIVEQGGGGGGSKTLVVTYNGSNLFSEVVSSSTTRTLSTGGTYVEGDFEIQVH